MTIVILIYILLLIGFFSASALIFRHLVKYGYLSPRFKIVVMIFGILSSIIIIFSIYLMLSMNDEVKDSPASYDYSSDLNF